MSASPILFQPLIGLFLFAAKKGHGSFVTFGLTTTPETPVEEFYFWIYLCNWWIRTKDSELAHCESTDDEIVSAVSALNGRKLNEIVLYNNVTEEGLFHSASLSFTGGLTMKLCQYEDSAADDAIFMTRNAAKQWISYYADGSIQTEPRA